MSTDTPKAESGKRTCEGPEGEGPDCGMCDSFGSAICDHPDSTEGTSVVAMENTPGLSADALVNQLIGNCRASITLAFGVVNKSWICQQLELLELVRQHVAPRPRIIQTPAAQDESLAADLDSCIDDLAEVLEKSYLRLDNAEHQDAVRRVRTILENYLI